MGDGTLDGSSTRSERATRESGVSGFGILIVGALFGLALTCMPILKDDGEERHFEIKIFSGELPIHSEHETQTTKVASLSPPGEVPEKEGEWEIRVAVIEGHPRRLENEAMESAKCKSIEASGWKRVDICEYSKSIRRGVPFVIHIRASSALIAQGKQLNHTVWDHELRGVIAFRQVPIRYSCGEVTVVSLNGVPTPLNSKINHVYLPFEQVRLGKHYFVELLSDDRGVVDDTCIISLVPREGFVCVISPERCRPAEKPPPYQPNNPSNQPDTGGLPADASGAEQDTDAAT